MSDQVIEYFHYSNMQITNNISVHTLTLMLMMHSNKSILNAKLQFWIRLLGFMHIMHTVELQEMCTTSTRQELLNVRRNWQHNTEFQDI
jgi:hypothetical protein